MKRYLALVLMMSLVLPMAAAASDVTSDGVTLKLPSDGSEYTLSGGGSFHSLEPSGGSFIFSVSDGSRINLSSADKKIFDSTYQVPTTCGTNESSAVWTFPGSGTRNVTITPSGACAAGGGGGSAGGGGGGGGGGGAGSFTPAPAPATVDKVTQLKQQIAEVQAQITQRLAGQAGALAAAGAIAKDLLLGNRGDEVTLLQTLLARDKAIYPEGLVTGFFGPATRQAVRKFQEKYGLPAVGRVGPQTRAKLSEVFGAVPPAAAPSAAPEAPPAAPAAAESVAPVSAVSAGIPSRNLAPGERDDQVRGLQELLAGDPEIYPEGTASGYFGPATTRAVRRFQLKYGVIQSETDAGNGRLGPKTRAKLEEVFGGAVAAVPTPSPAPAAAEAPAAAPAPAPAAAPAAGNEAQIKAVQEQIRAIQAKIIQEQIKLIQEKIKALQK